MQLKHIKTNVPGLEVEEQRSDGSASPQDAYDSELCISPLSQFFCNAGEQSPDIIAVVQLQGHLTFEKAVPVMQHLSELHDRFRRRVVFKNGAWLGEYLQDFNVRSLCQEVTLDGPDAQAAFDEYMSKRMSGEPLGNNGLPPWDGVLIHYSADPTRSDIVLRMSHMIADGHLILKLLRQITVPQDSVAQADYAAVVLGGASPVSGGGAGEQQQQQRMWLLRAVFFLAGLVMAGFRWLGGCWSGFTALLYSTGNIFYSDPVNAVKAAPEECWGKRKIASRTLPLDDFKATAKQLGVTINTLAVSCVGGGVRRYLQAQQQAVPKSVRMLVTVDTRALKSAPAGSGKDSMSRVPANCFTYIAVPVCTGDISPVERLGRVDRAIDWIRHSPALMLAVVMPVVTKCIYRDIKKAGAAMIRLLPAKATLCFSNVRGLQGSWTFGGVPVSRIYNAVQPSAMGCVISLLSYGDVITFAHTCYASKTSTPGVLLDCIAQEYAALREAASLKLCKAGENTDAQAGSSIKHQKEPAGCNTAEDQA
ncbi:hypothetical protein OEZ85_005383 [Tetradesmus obliquus]|uniref:Diacylglycerol O-acyltransferase n=1 Tax=Tetradesmus obliquus TaxID=3088 RepID=A0ABY8ULD7_TETOB|nr:hypothetical protein OEZ85_005383 [Tetradesmus obliquus]